MPDLIEELTTVGELARIRTLRQRGIRSSTVATALAAGLVFRPRHGWIASQRADADQLRALAVGAPIGCCSALRRFGVWAGTSESLHLQAPRTVARLDRSRIEGVDGASLGVWHPSVAVARRENRIVMLSRGRDVRLHWGVEVAPAAALDWVVSPQTALATSLRCLDEEHASAAIDSIRHERVLSRRQVDVVLAAVPAHSGRLVDQFTGRAESGAESLFIRRMHRAGHVVQPQFELEPHGRYDGVIDGCVLFEVDGRAHHSTATTFFDDHDRTMVAQSLGVPVVRPSALHVLEAWPATLAAVARVVEDAKLVRHARGLPPIQ